MANVLTGLVSNAYKAWNIVSREKVGFIQAMYMPPAGLPIGLAPGGVTQTYRVPIAAAASSANNTPAVAPPNTGDETSTYADVTMTKSKHVPIRFQGEEQLGLENPGGAFDMLYQARLAEGFRTLVNEMEADAYAMIRVAASRAYGTAATAPFATAADLQDLSNTALILDDNGCPDGDRQLVLANSAINNLRGKQSQLFKVNEAGSSDLLRTGMTERLEGFAIRQSGQISSVTKGTGASYQSNQALSAIGTTSIAVDTGTGTVLAGDFVTFTGDTNKYVVKTGIAAAGTLVLQEPGLRQTLADDVAMTVGGTSKHNLAFDRASVVWLTREPAMGKDLATAQSFMEDPLTGIRFGLAIYPGFGQTTVHVRLAWGGGVVKGAHIADLLG